MKVRAWDMQLECDQAFHRWCADEMVDLRMVEILEDAFTNGFWAGRALDMERVETTPAPETAA